MRYVLLLALLSFTGCAATYKRSDLASPATKLDRSLVVLIATPADGSYDGQTYAGSGQTTSLAVRSAFSKFAMSTSVARECHDLACLTRQTQPNVGYYVVPEILHWEERATEWSGKPDRIEIQLSIYDESSKEVAATVVTGKSKWATFGGDHPEDLLPEPLGAYVGSLY